MSKCLIANISKELLKEFKYEYSYLKANDLEIEMKDLVLESNLIETKLLISFPFVYFYDYEEKDMQEISAYFKEKGIYAIYCASTNSNLLWTLKELLNEIIKEHQIFSSMHTLQDLIKKTIQLPINENKEKIEKTLMKSFIVLQEKKLDEMNEMIFELKKILEDSMK